MIINLPIDLQIGARYTVPGVGTLQLVEIDPDYALVSEIEDSEVAERVVLRLKELRERVPMPVDTEPPF